MSEEKFSKCEEGEKKMWNFGCPKKKELKGKFRRKKSKCFWGNFKVKILVAIKKVKVEKKKCSGR